MNIKIVHKLTNKSLGSFKSKENINQKTATEVGKIMFEIMKKENVVDNTVMFSDIEFKIEN